MNSTSIRGTLLAAFFAAMFLLSVVPSEAKVVKAACSVKKGINAAIAKLKPGDTLMVSGSCLENVVVPEQINRVIIDGQDSATTSITPADPTGATVNIRGRDVTLRNFTVNGGQTGIGIRAGGTAVIENNIVTGASANGVLLNQQAFARITNNTIQNNGSCGVSVTENSNARVGFLSNNDVNPSPNTITGNNRGVCVSESSSANIMANTINNNTLDGILIDTVSYADIGFNAIDDNGEHGINVGRNSSVRVGRDTPTNFFDSPNRTTVNNGLFGLRCFINSSVDGKIGTLNGASGATDISTGGCINSTIP
jgi:nitrous oxidase accessory protein NosD